MSLQFAILDALSDGHFHSGEDLAQRFDVTRAAVWKALKQLEKNYTIGIDAVQGRGYRLSQAVELLDADRIKQSMRQADQLSAIETHLSIASTNDYLMTEIDRDQSGPRAVFAETQTAGRGRRGRQWLSPFGGNLYFSLSWNLDQAASDVMGLSLAAGVVISRVLERHFDNNEIHGIQLKWPNDILYQNAKLAGILVELKGETNGPYAIVLGAGLNINLSDEHLVEIDQPCISLAQLSKQAVSRNLLAAELMDELIEMMQIFDTDGLEPYIPEWKKRDVFRDHAVDIVFPNQTLHGIARGIDRSGALMLEQDGRVKRYFSGEISLRKRAS